MFSDMAAPGDCVEERRTALRLRVAGTSISAATLLSADYFNLFNEVIMVLGIVPDLVEDVENWRFKTYEEHFRESGLPFAGLAIEAYRAAPADTLELFEGTVAIMRDLVEEARKAIRTALLENRIDEASAAASSFAEELQAMVSMGATVVNGRQSSMDQAAIDGLF